jgi:heat shock protein HslJ
VHGVTTRGRRRRRLQHGLQIGGTAVVVAAIAVGATLVSADSGPGPTAPAAATPPTQSQLLGDWHLISPTPSFSKTGENEDPNLITFAATNGQLGWSGYDGCNGVSAKVRLGPLGSFTTYQEFMTDRGCLGIATRGSAPVTGVSVVEAAASASLRGETLSFYDKGGTLVGTFARDAGTTVDTSPPGEPPTQAQLLGDWRLTSPKPSLDKTGPSEDPNLVTFAIDQGQLWWWGYDGCNWVNGPVTLETDGRFSTSQNAETLRGCVAIDRSPTPDVVTGVSVIERAALVRLTGEGRLSFYDQAGTLVGTFAHVE